MSNSSILLNYHNGIPFDIELDVNWIAQIPDYPISPGDLYIVTYAKSGTTWTQQIVALIQRGGEKNQSHLMQVIPWLEIIGKEAAFALSPPRTLKSHLPYDMMPGRDPANSIGKYIYIARNPKDVAVSFYYHTKRHSEYNFTGDWDCYFELFIKGEVEFGLWFDHVLSWWRHKDAKNILFLKYEDLKKDLPGSVKTIAQFMGYSLDDATIDKITRQSTFESMKDDPLATIDSLPLKFPVVSSSTPFIRKGVIGDWKNHFTDEQSARFDAEYTKRMSGTGLVFDFE
ncbi:PREDICTED: sulfotransferase 1C2A-like [Amphimedon queenslandica]|uniref:Sulfotransferase domain-containing protein n=1 Tax=Amphimedon queenslandica TaxID=400682 RepID=A0A1X7VFD4_AMPQE|nr:PREDICTED: sulfotransferase 1C2A-like [Amphimedon queenslandica]XP_019849089.1 PREDICTED: sulfotransferase 1C2A-like [Amphimedon queenslandica]|eukprot:XP_019849088.1 PREDICTED: sulfotransferase 1C2A-like [Amphimedon queenslandica]